MMESFEFTYTPRKGFQQRIAVSGTPGNTALDPNIAGTGKVRIVAVGAEVQFYLTTSGSDAVVNNATTGDTCGYSLPAGASEDFYLTNQTRIAHVASGAGFVVLLRAGKERIGQ